jgi:hypothetical protein
MAADANIAEFRGARASGVLVVASRDDELCRLCGALRFGEQKRAFSHHNKSARSRDTIANTRDACATLNSR